MGKGCWRRRGHTERNSGRCQGPGCGCRAGVEGGVEVKVTAPRVVRWARMSSRMPAGLRRRGML